MPLQNYTKVNMMGDTQKYDENQHSDDYYWLKIEDQWGIR